MTLLLTADLHLSDRSIDAYRFRVLEWLAKAVRKYDVMDIAILGDVTEAKDHHSADLVNRIVESLRAVATVCPVTIVRGNHDGLNPDMPFFKWLRYYDNINFVTEPTKLTLNGQRVLALPHTKIKEGYQGEYDFSKFDIILAHQTFDGARGENGKKLPGISASVFGNTKARIYSGDVHVPQRVGQVEYVGSPYHIHFGDPFVPRVLIDDGKRCTDVTLKTVRKHNLSISNIDQLDDAKLREGDQIKVEFHMFRSDFGTWDGVCQQIRKFSKRAKVDLCGTRLVEKVKGGGGEEDVDRREYLADPQTIFNNFCQRNAERVSKSLRASGQECLQ